jgi:chromate transporter
MRQISVPSPDSPHVKTAEAPTLSQIFTAFSKIGLTSFGGGMSGWMLREFVQRRQWVTEAEFLSGLALAQAFPGVNVVNLSIWIGFRLRGGRGALVGMLGIVCFPMLVAMLLVALFSTVSNSHVVHEALAGIAAAAIGLSLQTGLRAAKRSTQDLIPLALMIASFAGIYTLRLPLLWVVGALAPISIVVAFIRQRRKGDAP